MTFIFEIIRLGLHNLRLHKLRTFLTSLGIILGVANKRSIAWACAKSLSREGMRLAFTYIGERMEKSVRALAEECPGSIVLPCDVTKPEEIDNAFEQIGDEFGYLDAVVHAGSDVRFGLLAGRFIGEGTLLRFYVLHCVGFPLIAATLMAIHFWRIRKDGGISGPL